MRILVGYDGSSSARAALEKAVELFTASRPEIVVFGAFQRPMSTDPLAGAAYDALRDEARDELKAVVEEVGRGGLTMRGLLVEGEPREVLDQLAISEEPDVVVVGARGQNKLAKLLLGSVSTYAVKHLPCPVLVVRESGE